MIRPSITATTTRRPYGGATPPSHGAQIASRDAAITPATAPAPRGAAATASGDKRGAGPGRGGFMGKGGSPSADSNSGRSNSAQRMGGHVNTASPSAVVVNSASGVNNSTSNASSLNLSHTAVGHVQLSDLSEGDKQKVAKLVQHLMALGADNDNLRKELEATRAASEVSINQRNAESSRVLEIIKAELDSRIEEVNVLQAKRLSALDLLARYQLKISELVDEVRSQSRSSSEARLAMDRMKQEYANMQLLLDSQSQSIVSLREQLASGNSTYRNTSSVVAERLADVEDQLARRTDALKREEAKSQGLERTISQLQEQISSMRLIMQEKDASIARLNESLLQMSKENSEAVAARVGASLNRSLLQHSEQSSVNMPRFYDDNRSVSSIGSTGAMPTIANQNVMQADVRRTAVPERSDTAFQPNTRTFTEDASNLPQQGAVTSLAAPPLVAPAPPLLRGGDSPPRIHINNSTSTSTTSYTSNPQASSVQTSSSDASSVSNSQKRRNAPPPLSIMTTSNNSLRSDAVSSIDSGSLRSSAEPYDYDNTRRSYSALDALEEPEEIEGKRGSMTSNSAIARVSQENRAPPQGGRAAATRPVSSAAATALSSSLVKSSKSPYAQPIMTKKIRFASTKNASTSALGVKKVSAVDSKRPKAGSSSAAAPSSPSRLALSRMVFPESPGGALVREVFQDLDSNKAALYDPVLFDMLDEMDSTDSTISTIPRSDPLLWH